MGISRCPPGRTAVARYRIPFRQRPGHGSKSGFAALLGGVGNLKGVLRAKWLRGAWEVPSGLEICFFSPKIAPPPVG